MDDRSDGQPSAGKTEAPVVDGPCPICGGKKSMHWSAMPDGEEKVWVGRCRACGFQMEHDGHIATGRPVGG